MIHPPGSKAIHRAGPLQGGRISFGAADLQAAIREAIERDVPHPNAVRLALERRREARGEAPPVAIDLLAAVRERDAPVRPHALEPYDQLGDATDE